jgi:hypothetical protein
MSFNGDDDSFLTAGGGSTGGLPGLGNCDVAALSADTGNVERTCCDADDNCAGQGERDRGSGVREFT